MTQVSAKVTYQSGNTVLIRDVAKVEEQGSYTFLYNDSEHAVFMALTSLISQIVFIKGESGVV